MPKLSPEALPPVWRRRRSLTDYAKRIRENSILAETVEDEIRAEDILDYALDLIEESRWKGVDTLVEAACAIAYAEGIIGAS